MKTRNSCYTYFKIVGEFDPQEISNILGLNAEKSWRIGDTRTDGSKYENDISFYLEIVPTIYAEETTPCLALPLDIIDFCHATRTEIDIDLYVLDSSDENE